MHDISRNKNSTVVKTFGSAEHYYYFLKKTNSVYLEQLRRCVRGRPAERVQVLVDLVHLGGEAKVPNLDQGHVGAVGVGGGGGGREGGGGGGGPEEGNEFH